MRGLVDLSGLPKVINGTGTAWKGKSSTALQSEAHGPASILHNYRGRARPPLRLLL